MICCMVLFFLEWVVSRYFEFLVNVYFFFFEDISVVDFCCDLVLVVIIL